MKKWLLAAAVCVLTACSSGGESKTYYQLPVAQGGAQSAASQGARPLWGWGGTRPDYPARRAAGGAAGRAAAAQPGGASAVG